MLVQYRVVVDVDHTSCLRRLSLTHIIKIGLHEVLEVANELKDKNSTGDDKVPTEFYKCAPLELF